MADLSLTFSDLYNECLKKTGEYNAGSPSTTATTDAKFIVNRAYLRFCNAFEWSFLRPERELITLSGQWRYDLPADFTHMVFPRFTYDDDNPYHPTQERSFLWLQNERSGVTYNSFPEYHAIWAGPYTKEVGQTWVVGFYPTPDDAYTLHYVSRISPLKLENDNDRPIGGAEMSDCLLELCLAYAESYKDEQPGVNSAAINAIIQPAIEIDLRRRPRALGSLGIPSARPVYGQVIEGWTVETLT